MKVIAFAQDRPSELGHWRDQELRQLVGTFAPALAEGVAGGWETAATEPGDPQFYLLGPPPDVECILCVSRLGRLYVLEDGAGRVVFEDVKLEPIAEHAKRFIAEKKSGLVAQVALLWAMLRQTFEEKVEPLLAEGEEFLFHMAPQLAALA